MHSFSFVSGKTNKKFLPLFSFIVSAENKEKKTELYDGPGETVMDQVISK
jgi:hypothetical protein